MTGQDRADKDIVKESADKKNKKTTRKSAGGTGKKSAKGAAAKNLVIVESPSKAKTIGKFLGSKYKVMASVGHVRDLPKSRMGIDIENNFEPQYINIRGKGEIIKELKKEAKKADKVFLATDPDREGEAISWHLAHLLGMDGEEECRVEFNEITKDTIREAIKHPRKLDLNLVDAQQARRVLDRLVGYQISPLLWRKIRWGLSAGRVQSAALKLICLREEEIRNFVPEEYWTITALLKGEKDYEAKLIQYKGEKISVGSEEQTEKIIGDVKAETFRVENVEEKKRQRRPYPPFTTSSLQQDASNKLNFSTKKTMLIAQQLYEGVDIKGMGTIGLVTYIRTDSVRISDEARRAAKDYVVEQWGPEYYSDNVYSNKKKDVQDAHEAIRVSRIDLTPDLVKDSLSRDQYNLYKLIWSRYVASQMSPAQYTGMTVDIKNGDYTFRANGSKLEFLGFLKVYSPSKKEEDRILPHIEEGDSPECRDVRGEQNFTQPPARFTEASLIKELEDKDIGRPSTYAPIVVTLTERKYVEKDKKSLVPTDLGSTVNEMMEEYFKEIVDIGFTADMEDKLDRVESQGIDWRKIIADFYGPFEKELEYADTHIEKMKVEDEETDEICELCGRNMVIKHGRYGDFLACKGYPDCKNTRPIVKSIGVKCPACGKDIVERRSKKGRIFYGCSGYPECDQSFWDRPVDKKCPECGSLLVQKKGKKGLLECSNSQCGYRKEIDNTDKDVDPAG